MLPATSVESEKISLGTSEPRMLELSSSGAEQLLLNELTVHA